MSPLGVAVVLVVIVVACCVLGVRDEGNPCGSRPGRRARATRTNLDDPGKPLPPLHGPTTDGKPLRPLTMPNTR
jgi:hypothetical protein